MALVNRWLLLRIVWPWTVSKMRGLNICEIKSILIIKINIEKISTQK